MRKPDTKPTYFPKFVCVEQMVWQL